MNNSTEPVGSPSCTLSHGTGYWSWCGHWCLVRIPHDGGPVTVARWRCGSWNCEDCTATRARAWFKRALMGAEMAPASLRFVTLTFATAKDASATWALQGACWNRLRTSLTREVGRYEYLRVMEYTQRGYPHVHALMRGPYLPQPVLSRLAERAGYGPVCWVTRPRQVRQAGRYVVKYILKATATPMPKGTRRVLASYAWEGPGWHPRPRTPDPDATWELIKAPMSTVLNTVHASGAPIIVRDWWKLEAPPDGGAAREWAGGN